jgi:hypothetical protein
MLTRHAAGKAYFHANIPRLLTDASVVIMHEKVDFVKLRTMADQWKLPFPGNLLAAFTDFFPTNVIESFCPDQMEKARFQLLFEKKVLLGTPQNVPLMLNQFYAKGILFQGLWTYLFKYGPERVCTLYHLSAQSNWLRIAWSYIEYYTSRIWRVFSILFKPDKDLRDYCFLVEAMESNSVSGRDIMHFFKSHNECSDD